MAYDRANIVLYYDTGGGNIFTRENLKTIEYIEHTVFNMANYSQYCVQNATLKCQKPTSVLRYFDGSMASIDRDFYDPHYNNIPKVLYKAMTHNETKGDFAYFLSQDHLVTTNIAHAPVTRTILPMGFPLTLKQSVEEMENEMEEFLVKTFKPLVSDLKDTANGFSLVYWSYLLFRHDIVIQIFFDMTFAIGSILFIFAFIVYHTKSLWISTFAVSSILTSFLCTNLIYRIVFDFKYIGYFHVITLFIILGIGADDIFVFLDVWKTSGYQEYSSLSMRLTCAYKKSIKSMFFTSLTTTVAFLASANSPLLATRSFGVFAGVLVIVNYISVVIYFPTVIITHHFYFKNKSWPCFSRKILTLCSKSTKDDEPLPPPPAHNVDPIQNINSLFEDNSVIGTTGKQYNVVGRINAAFQPNNDEYGFMSFKNSPYQNVPGFRSNGQTNGIGIYDEVPESEQTPTETSSSVTDVQKRKFLVRFFRDHYFRFVTHYIAKWVIVVLLMALVAFFTYSASNLTTDTEQVFVTMVVPFKLILCKFKINT